jgi:hypothetical protein
MSLYLMAMYGGCGEPGEAANPHADWLKKAWLATGKKLDMGKACIRFKKLEDLPLEVVGEAIHRIPAALWIKNYTIALAKKVKRVITLHSQLRSAQISSHGFRVPSPDPPAQSGAIVAGGAGL